MTEAPADSAEWWLDEAALPERRWAALRLAQDGWTVRDPSDALIIFESAEAARGWLREDGFARLTDLIADGELPAGTAPPPHLSRPAS